jgi:hypothetical protein
MSDQEAPRVFVSHSSADKQRFVLGFATRLREKGIEAWVDRWEMLAGDSLGEKVYEEGLGQADAVVAVISENSLASPWVRDELNTAKVRQITRRCKLIPVIIGDVDEERIPVILGNTIWARIVNLDDYGAELKGVVDAIYGHTDRPRLGGRPAYLTSPIEVLPGLTRVDSILLKICGDLAMEEGDSLFILAPDAVIAKAEDLGIGEEQAADSLEILEDEGLVILSRVHGRDGRGIATARLSDFGFDEYLNVYYEGFVTLMRDVGFRLLNSSERQQDADQVAGSLEAPVAVVRHIVRRFQERNFVYATRIGEGNVIVTEARPRLRRWLEEEAER